MIFSTFTILLLVVAVSAEVPSCNWVQSDYFGVLAIDVCVEGGWSGTHDTIFTCAIDPQSGSQIAVQYAYPLSSGCSGGNIDVSVVTDPTRFDCSQSTCTDYVIWPWYFNCTGPEYSKQASIPNMCLDQGNSYQLLQIYNDSSLTPSFDMEIWDFADDSTCNNVDHCYTMGDGPPSKNAECGAEFVTSYTGTPNAAKIGCNGGSNGGSNDTVLDGEYNISINIDCNWVYDSEWIQVIGICDAMIPDPTDPDSIYDSQIVCNGTAVSRNYYASNDGSCSGDIVHEEFFTDNPTLFDCSMGICGENNFIKFRRFDACNTSVAGFSTENMVINQCFHDIEDGTDYFVTCDSNLDGFRYGYDTGDPKCSALTADMAHYTDLNTECEMHGDEEASYEVLACYGSVTSESPTKSPTDVPTDVPTTTTIITTGNVAAANRISDYIFSIITVVICAFS